MKNLTTCFVIIGFGKKTSYANGKLRILDLDETYSLLIKPVFDALQIPCYRAIDKNLSGNIDKLMLQEIKNADIAVVDISTLNANVMWELGVRHALKPRHTIMICEKEQMSNIPFDINHFVVHQYTHSEEGIPFKEVEKFKTHLTKVVEGVLTQPSEGNDSPVFTFLENELNKDLKVKAITSPNPTRRTNESFASLLDKAEQAKKQKEYSKALQLFGTAKEHAKENMTLKENLAFIISRQALCTYKSKKPTELKSLENAKDILEELNPQQSNDIEVMGLTGAINKRLCELVHDTSYLDNSILSYEKGFQLKQDYYNGINAAFMLYKKAGILKTQGKNWEDTKLKADCIRNAVLEISLKLEKKKDFEKMPDALWILLTIAESFNYKDNTEKQIQYETKASIMAEKKQDPFAMGAYYDQKKKIKKIKLNLK
jgi:hypothetical protein